MQPTDPNGRQLDTLRIYGALLERREDWGGGLVLCCAEGCASSGIPAAVSIAGGATLAIDGDGDALKSAMRSGELDFVVNSLDEALRALKNQVRQRRPLSVGLVADTALALEEVVERGVLPDLLLIGFGQPAQQILQSKSIGALRALGMPLRLIVDPSSERPIRPAMTLSRKRHYEVYLPAADASELRTLDERLQAIFTPEDIVRRRWIQRVPQYLREARNGGRWVWLSEEEQQQLCD